RGVKEFFFQVAFDFVTQMRKIMDAQKMGRSAFAKRLGVSKGRVSQVLNGPSNLTLENIVRYSWRLNRKVAVVLYDDGDRRNKNGPIPPDIFVECWKRQGRPRDFFELNRFSRFQPFTFWKEKPKEAVNHDLLNIPITIGLETTTAPRAA